MKDELNSGHLKTQTKGKLIQEAKDDKEENKLRFLKEFNKEKTQII